MENYRCSYCNHISARNSSSELRRDGFGWFCSYCQANIVIIDYRTFAGRHIVKKFYKFESINSRKSLAPISFKIYAGDLVKLLFKLKKLLNFQYQINSEMDNIHCKKLEYNLCPSHTSYCGARIALFPNSFSQLALHS